MILIFAIVGYCISQAEVDQCEAEFKNLLKGKCEAIGSCTYDSLSSVCFKYKACDQVSQDEDCSSNKPENFIKYKCQLDTTCNQIERECGEYGTDPNIPRDNCTALKAPADQRCILMSIVWVTGGTNIRTRKPSCTAQYYECSKINTDTNFECSLNVPLDPSKKCEWKENYSSPGICEERNRYCNEAESNYYMELDKDFCSVLKIQSYINDYEKKKCIYDGNICKEEYITCEERPETSPSDCNGNMPLNEAQDD